jgi:hypothetical protein
MTDESDVFARDLGDEPDDRPHVAADLAAGQGWSDDAEALPAEDVAQLAGIRGDVDQTAFASSEEVDRLGTMTDTRVLEGELEARPPDSDQPDEPDASNIEMLTETELRDGETDDPGEAAEEGLTYVPPVDPPVVMGEGGMPEIAAGFGTTADDEPFDADHHDAAMYNEDERTERVREALLSHAATSALVDRLSFETVGSRIVVAGTLDDLDDEDQVLEVISEVDGITDVVNRIEIDALG